MKAKSTENSDALFQMMHPEKGWLRVDLIIMTKKDPKNVYGDVIKLFSLK